MTPRAYVFADLRHGGIRQRFDVTDGESHGLRVLSCRLRFTGLGPFGRIFSRIRRLHLRALRLDVVAEVLPLQVTFTSCSWDVVHGLTFRVRLGG